MSQLKYVTAEIIDEVLPYIRKELERGKNLCLSEEEFEYLKQEVLNRCPSCLELDKCSVKELKENFIPFDPKGKFKAFRVIVEYEGTLKKSFYPQLIINESEKKYVINRYLISAYLAYLKPLVPDKKYKDDDMWENLIAGICSLLSVSLFTTLRGAKQLAQRMGGRGKKVIGICEGCLSSREGKYFGKNPKVKVNWYPYSEIDEWKLFKRLFKIKNLEDL